jgi:uncharacterized membrane protein YphA (DoxX/SURF4 family)
MLGMNATTQADFQDSIAMPGWKTAVGHIAAAAVGLLFLAAGIGKMSVPFMVQTMFEQLLVPTWGSLPLVMALAIIETLGGILILIPKYRRWGAWIITLLLLVFMGYIGIRYGALVGRDCSCFPWLKRAVNAAFFLEDGVMLAASVAAGWFSRKPAGLKIPIQMLAAICVVAGGAYAYNVAHQSGIQVPPTITVDGKSFNLHEGNIFLYFYDPHCSHCTEAAQHMATYHWKSDVKIIGLPTDDPEAVPGFLGYTKLSALTSLDTATLRKLFVFTSPPYGVALQGGRVKSILTHFDEPEPLPSLQQAGFVE